MKRLILPKYRLEDYAIWKACERFHILPPNVTNSWDNCNIDAKAMLIAYNQVRDTEDAEDTKKFFKGLFG